MRIRFLTPLLMLVVAGIACAPDIPQESRGPFVQAVFDPSTASLPVPNDLALVNNKVAIAPREDRSAAENELSGILNGRDGFSIGSTVKAKFTGPLSAASLSHDTVYALDLGDHGRGTPSAIDVSFDYEDCDASVTVVPAAPLVKGHTYLFAVRGGATGVKDAGGNPIAPMPAFHFLRAGEDLRNHPDAIPGATRAEREAAAAQLETVRQGLEPLFQILEKNGMPRRDVAVLWHFTALTSGEALFDPASKRIPFPNDLLRDPKTGIVNVPIDPKEAPEQQALKRGFNTMDGFSTTAAITLESTEPLDRSTVKARETVHLLRRDTLEEVTDFTATVTADGKTLVIQPKTPLRPKTAYVVAVSGVKDERQNLLNPMPLAALLSLKNPLVVDGHSAISALCDETAARLEALRAAMVPALAKLEEMEKTTAGRGIVRPSLSAAWTFTTEDIVAKFKKLYAAPYEANLPLAMTDIVNKSPFERGLGISMPFVARVITGKMTTQDFLDPTTRAFREGGAGVPSQIEFVLTIPTGQQKSQPIPVVVFGHGLFTERRLALFVADTLAERGFATFAIDLPLHGERSVCLQDNQCESGAVCAKDGHCLKNGMPADFARVPNLWPNFGPSFPGLGKGTPTATGQAFIDVENLFGARDHFRQAIVDLSAQTRLVRFGKFSDVTGGFSLDSSKVYWAGISLGGILGGVMSGVDPIYQAMLLNVGGAGLPELMIDSATLGVVLKQGLAQHGIKEGSPEFFAFGNAAKWVFDEVDPINIAHYAVVEPLETIDPATGNHIPAKAKRIRLQMANSDAVVPNSATERLLAAEGVDKAKNFRAFTGTHGFLADPGEPNYLPGQIDMADFLEGKK